MGPTDSAEEPEKTRDFIENAFRDGEIKTIGTGIDSIMPKVSRFKGRTGIKQGIIDRLKAFFEKFFSLGCSFTARTDKASQED